MMTFAIKPVNLQALQNCLRKNDKEEFLNPLGVRP